MQVSPFASRAPRTLPPPAQLTPHRPQRRVKLFCVLGTRPEVIKMAPLVQALRQRAWADPVVVATGQQQDLLDDMLADVGLKADVRMPYGETSHSPASFLAHCLQSLETLIEAHAPDGLIAQGDTTTVHAAAMAAFYRRLPFVHLEAGLRTRDIHSPFPEEYHRRAIALATTLHCAPTQIAYDNLRLEGVDPHQVVLSGNTVIDSLLATAKSRPRLPADFPTEGRTLLLTLHRRENFGDNIRNALNAARRFVDFMQDVSLYFPMHPNPNAREAALELLSGHPRIHLVEPLTYREMVAALQASWCVMTDSGGLQEEAPALGKPVLVLRDSTERPEAVEAGVAELVGTEPRRILKALVALDCEPGKYEAMARKVFPFGDGHASERIADAMEEGLFAHLLAEAEAT